MTRILIENLKSLLAVLAIVAGFVAIIFVGKVLHLSSVPDWATVPLALLVLGVAVTIPMLRTRGKRWEAIVGILGLQLVWVLFVVGSMCWGWITLGLFKVMEFTGFWGYAAGVFSIVIVASVWGAIERRRLTTRRL